MRRLLTDRETAALRRADFDTDEIAEVAAAVAADRAYVYVEPSGDVRVVRRDRFGSTEAEVSEGWEGAM